MRVKIFPWLITAAVLVAIVLAIKVISVPPPERHPVVTQQPADVKPVPVAIKHIPDNEEPTTGKSTSPTTHKEAHRQALLQE